MARIPDSELERIKSEVSVQRLVEAAGIELSRGGKNLLGKCPWHEDTTASLVLTPHKNLWHCFACSIGGGPIDWVMKHQGVSFRHAVELLRTDPALAAVPQRAAVRSTVRNLAAPVALDADDQALLAQTIEYYHQRLKENAQAQAYLKVRGLAHPALIDTFRLGVADRTLGLRLPNKQRVAGATIRERLQKLGILRASGHEHFNGSLVIPVFDAAGQVVEVYGRKLQEALRAGTPKHLYLPQPEDGQRPRGVFNLAGLQAAGARPVGQRDAILCEALIDALTFWCHGFTHVTSSYGTEGFTPEILQALKANAIERVLLAYDRDEPGERAAQKVAALLIEAGFEVLRVQFPKGMDANEFALKMQPAAKALALVLHQAQWIGGVRAAPAVDAAPEPAPQEQPSPGKDSSPPSLAAVPSRAAPAAEVGPLPDEVQHEGEACSWRVRGWKKNTTPEAMRVNVQVRSSHGGYFVDTLDLFAARSRQAFVKQASSELGLGENIVKRELGQVLLKLEGLQDELMLQARKPAAPAAPILSAEEEEKALQLLRAPDLMQRIVADLHALGVVGEDMNLMAAYLAAVSRKLDAPLAVLIQSTSAAGKSALMDAVLALVPPEERIRYSAMTGQSLYYLGETNLQHKVLAIAEEEGVRQAAYALKLLQSDGELTIASTAKDEASGNLQTRQYTVRGPVMLMLTTTAIDVDEELLNRCLVLSVNESREQTAAIHARQRQRQTLQGLLARAGRQHIEQLHHNAQRLLTGVAVVNPYAERLTFLADKTRTRRDHMKYLALIQAIALLHQHQRQVKEVEHAGQVLRYIEVTKEDIALANAIAHEVLGRTLDELPPQTRKLLILMRDWVATQCAERKLRQSELRFTRRQLRDAVSWGDTQLKVHLGRLVELEYVAVHRRGLACEYELLYDGKQDAGGQAHVNGLIDVASLDDSCGYDTTRSGVQAIRSGSGRGSVGPRSEGGRGGLEVIQARAGIGVAADVSTLDAKPRIKANGATSLAAVVAAS